VSKIAKKSKIFKKWYGGKIRVKMVGSKFWENIRRIIESGSVGSSKGVGRVQIWGKW